MLLRSRFLIDVIGINQTKGRMFRVDELVEEVESIMDGSGEMTATESNGAALPIYKPADFASDQDIALVPGLRRTTRC